jgi:hypothetical protein
VLRAGKGYDEYVSIPENPRVFFHSRVSVFFLRRISPPKIEDYNKKSEVQQLLPHCDGVVVVVFALTNHRHSSKHAVESFGRLFGSVGKSTVQPSQRPSGDCFGWCRRVGLRC